jgi:hypothetical protein
MNCVEFTQKTLDFFLQTFYNNENIGTDMKNPHRESEKNKNHISGGNYYGRL